MKKNMEQQEMGKRRGKIRWALLMMFVALFCLASYKVSSQLLTEHKENGAFDDLLAQVEANRASASNGNPAVPAPAEGKKAEAASNGADTSKEPKQSTDGRIIAGGPTVDGSSGVSRAENENSVETTDDGFVGTETGEFAAQGKQAAIDFTRAEAAESAEPVVLEILPAYAPLAEQNPDLFGWIAIDDTVLNYPVMHTPEDPEYYLHRAFDGTDSTSGVPFLDANCALDCGNYIIYGHHMKNGSMFALLPSYASEDYWKEHPVIRFDTLYKTGLYEVIAAFYSKAYSPEDVGVFRYHAYTDLRDPERFDDFVEQMRAAALYDTGIEVEYGEQLLTLSTCEYHAKDGRFVVVAKEIN